MKKKMALFLILSMCMLGTATVHATESADGSQTENQSESQDAGTENRKSGWQVEDGGWYYYADGQRATGWLWDNGWYYLNPENGLMITGELQLGNREFYLDESGRMYEYQWRNTGEGWYYYGAEGIKSRGWIQLEDGWYYLDPNTGLMVTGELQLGSREFYLDKSGHMYEYQWRNTEEGWYYYGREGIKYHGWLQLEEGWYYLNSENGLMVTGELQLGNRKFYLDESGRMYENQWRNTEKGWYYYDYEGVRSSGWILLQDGWYYLNPNTGLMVTGKHIIQQQEYRFHESGRMYEKEWYKEKGEWYYYGTGGKLSTGWVYDGNVWYYMDKNGVMQTGWVSLNGTWYYMYANGAMASSTWLQLGREWYYVTTSGNMVTGWNQINGIWYYMYSNGVMAHDTVIDGYELNSSGAWNVALSAVNAAAQGVITLAGADLFSCYRWIVDNCTYQSFYEETPAGYTWQEWRAVQMFNNRYGDCHSFAALFGYTARALGYDAQIISGYTTTVSGKWVDHGWVEINGAIYDPDLEYELGYNCFGQSPFSYRYYL